MFSRRWFELGRIRSDEGFWIGFGHKSIKYMDDRGEVIAGYEDGYLFPDISRTGPPRQLIPAPERDIIVDRIVRALEWDRKAVTIWKGQRD